jgi:hypothetical protein
MGGKGGRELRYGRNIHSISPLRFTNGILEATRIEPVIQIV